MPREIYSLQQISAIPSIPPDALVKSALSSRIPLLIGRNADR
jgi:hypothetical protein